MTKLLILNMLVLAGVMSAAEPLFFAFDNGVGRGNLTPAQQAEMLKELSYAGIGYTGTTALGERQRAFDQAGLVITSLYRCGIARRFAAAEGSSNRGVVDGARRGR